MRYSDIVEVYGLDVLKPGVDFELGLDGDFKRTRDGHPQLGNDRFNAFFRLVRGWELNAPTLQCLFQSVISAPDREQTLTDLLNQVALDIALERMPPERLHELSDEIGANTLGGDAYAGTVLIVNGSLFCEVRKDLGIAGGAWRRNPALINGWSLNAIVEAGANSFRHHDEWRADWATKGFYEPRQKASIDVIGAVTGVTEERLLARNASADLLHLVSGGTWEQLQRSVFEFANSFA